MATSLAISWMAGTATTHCSIDRAACWYSCNMESTPVSMDGTPSLVGVVYASPARGRMRGSKLRAAQAQASMQLLAPVDQRQPHSPFSARLTRLLSATILTVRLVFHPPSNFASGTTKASLMVPEPGRQPNATAVTATPPVTL